MISLNRRKRVFSTDDTTVSRCHTTSSQAFHKFFGGSSVWNSYRVTSNFYFNVYFPPSDIPSTWMNYRSILSTRDLDRDLSNDSPSAQKDPGLIWTEEEGLSQK